MLQDGDTPLLKAVRSRQLDLVQLLMSHNAKVFAMDKVGDIGYTLFQYGTSQLETTVGEPFN